ncbi:MAG: DUF3788 family protein [Prolixibacteraceae bacterium]
MEPIVLTDPNVTPDNELVFSLIGDKKIYWVQILEHLYRHHKDISEIWRFYKDGKSWLFRTLKKKNTIFWVAILEDTFRVGFYFGDKAEPLIEQSGLPESIKNDFRNAKRFNAIRPVSVVIKGSEDVDVVIQLIELKLKIK